MTEILHKLEKYFGSLNRKFSFVVIAAHSIFSTDFRFVNVDLNIIRIIVRRIEENCSKSI